MNATGVALAISAVIVIALMVCQILALLREIAELKSLTAEADEIISRWSEWTHHATKLKRESDDWLRRRREVMFDRSNAP